MLKHIIEELKKGNFSVLDIDALSAISDIIEYLNAQTDDQIKNNKEDIDMMVNLITIGNITYNYSDSDVLPIDDSVYDMLVTRLQRIDYNRFTPGAIPVPVSVTNKQLEVKQEDMIKPFTVMSEEDTKKFEESFFPSILTMNKPYDIRANMHRPFITETTATDYVSKRMRTISHNYPNLVGTLEKCKIVLTKQAEEMGVLDQPSTTILERDFFVPLIQKGIIDYTTPIEMIGTLKYDGISIEADCTDEIVGARTRGDTDFDLASDLTPILGGYKFPNAPKLEKPIGIKFEAIILYDHLQEVNKLFGTKYINGRTAIIGLTSSSSARKIRDYITLVPIQVDFGDDTVKPDRVTEIEFLNKYYANREYIRYVYFNETYTNLLFLIKKYVEEAEYFRTWSNFMYDGVVLEFINPTIVNTLGRKNSINQYQMAVKFNPLERITTVLGFFYTVGQNGNITPMVRYSPIEFLGAIHTKSTLSSFERFNNLDLNIGDQIKMTYVNDVMPYVFKMDIESNRKNHMRIKTKDELFPTHCPVCGTELMQSSQGKTMFCPNMNCGGRSVARVTNMLNKLDVKDFSQSAVEQLNVTSFHELMKMSIDDFSVLGPGNKIKLYNELQKLRNNPLPDFRIIGALGFTNIYARRWQLIFKHYSLPDIYGMYLSDRANMKVLLSNIKGVGPVIADTIISEFGFFEEDIKYIIANSLYIQTPIGKEEDIKYVIRFTGFRDPQLAAVINTYPFVDCDGDAGVTKNTSILLVPNERFSSTKIDKAKKYGVKIVPVKEFMENTSLYIPELELIEF